MRGYILTVLGATLAAAVASVLVSDNGLSKHMRFLVSLAVICAIIGPLSGIKALKPDLTALVPDEYSQENLEGLCGELLTESCRGELEVRLTALTAEKFSLPADSVTVKIEADAENGRFIIRRAVVELRGMAIFADPYAIEEYIGNLCGCDCDTVY